MNELLVLGSSSGLPTRNRFPTSIALKTSNQIILLDCGAPVYTLLPRYGENLLDVTAVCISHWHVDHVAGLSLFLSQAMLMKRKAYS